MTYKYTVSWLLNGKRNSAYFNNVKAAYSFYWKLEEQGYRPSIHSTD